MLGVLDRDSKVIIVANMDRFVVLLPVYSCEYVGFTQLRDKYIIHDNVNRRTFSVFQPQLTAAIVRAQFARLCTSAFALLGIVGMRACVY